MNMPDDDKELPADDFSFWFALNRAADAKDWPLLKEYLDASPTQKTPRHTLTIAVLEATVLAGKSALTADILSRGYVPRREDLKAIVDKLEFVDGAEQEAVAQAFAPVVAAASEIDVRTLIGDAWRQIAAPVVVPQLAAAGFDVLLGGDAVEIAIDECRPELMQLLIEQGMSPFAPKMLREVFDEERRDEDTHRVWWQAVCAHGDARTALARFDHMRAAGNQWRAAAFVNPISYDRTGAPVTLLGILAARGRLAEVFDARHWREAREDAFKLHEALDAYGMKGKVTLAPFVAALKREDIKARQQAQRPDKFKL